MEFDILNEIITGTVAQLFTDLNKHANYMKTSSQMGQDKSEIPKSSYDVGNMSGRVSDRLDNNQDSVSQWLMVEAKARLNDTIAKLGLDS